MNAEAEPQRNSAGRIIAVTCVLCLAYSVVRYHIAGPVPWKDFPFFILNKAISLSAFVLLTFNFAFGPLRNLGVHVPEAWLNARKALGMTGFLLVLLHALMSFMLFSPAVYARFFEPDGSLTLVAGLSMLAGVVAFAVLWAMLLGAVHLFFMGYEGWLNPSGWHGGIPPISLVAFSFFVVGYGVNLLGRK